jgi:hypothetical protein
MLTAVQFIRARLQRLHQGLEKSLTPERLHAVPAIAWGLWHGTRTEDCRAVSDPGRASVPHDGGVVGGGGELARGAGYSGATEVTSMSPVQRCP